MNKCLFTGRIVRDAELSYLAGSGTPKMVFTLVVERSFQKDKNNKKVDFIPCEMLGKHCENLFQYVTKGKLISLEGELNIEQYEKDGEKKSFTKIKGDRLEFLGGGNGEKKEDAPYEPNLTPIDDDDIPF
jgi:single-strand DNA-binding protein